LLSSDLTVELSTRDDDFIRETPRLRLEIASNDEIMDKCDLLSHESKPGVWEADTVVLL
jgi:hypothetical protein